MSSDHLEIARLAAREGGKVLRKRLGNIGKLVAERALGLKMKVIACDPFITAEAASKLGVELVELEGLIENAEIITIHTPLTPETKDLINKDTFAKMKEGVIIGHDCKTCREHYEKCTWRDKWFVPDPFKKEAE